MHVDTVLRKKVVEPTFHGAWKQCV